jgi:hypothetical protein
MRMLVVEDNLLLSSSLTMLVLIVIARSIRHPRRQGSFQG